MLHEKLECYRRSIEVARRLNRLIMRWPRGYGYLADQLKRALASVILNLAEGNSRVSTNERMRFFQISRSSFNEVAACIDLMEIFMLMRSEEASELKSEASQISRMIYRLS